MWVGTLGAGVSFMSGGQRVYGALTNAHVAVPDQPKRGTRQHQPTTLADWFAKLDRWSQIDTSASGRNRVDLALLDSYRADGPFAPGTHTVGPELLGIGRVNSIPYGAPGVDDLVIKSGRTTGVTTGVCVGVGATIRVTYPQGSAVFVDQLVIRSTRTDGDFSAGGDSGSLIVTVNGRHPWGLVFAGGGGTTIANPIEAVMAFSDVEFF